MGGTSHVIQAPTYNEGARAEDPGVGETGVGIEP